MKARTKESLRKEMRQAIQVCDFLRDAKQQGISPRKCMAKVFEIYTEIGTEDEESIQFFKEWVTDNLDKDSFSEMLTEWSSGSFQIGLLGLIDHLEERNQIADCESEEDFTEFLEELSDMAYEARMRFERTTKK